MRILCFLLITASFIQVANAEDYAAQEPFGGGVAPVVWGSTAEEASDKAIRACKQLNKRCSAKPVIPSVSKYNMFVTTCCKVDGVRCQTVATALDEDAGRNEAFNQSLKAFADAGFDNSHCWRERTYSVKTGKRLRD